MAHEDTLDRAPIPASSTASDIETRFNRVERVAPPDPFHDDDPTSARVVMDEFESLMRLIEDKNPMRSVGDDQITTAFFERSPGLATWANTIPSAAALWPLYHPTKGVLHDGQPVDEVAQAFFRHCLDARGIRSRGAVTADILTKQLAECHPGATVRWASLACGAAEAVCPVAADALRQGANLTVDLIDRDPIALGLAMQTATNVGCSSAVRIHELDILRLDELTSTLGSGVYDVVDILGFFEYLPTVPPEGWTGAGAFLRTAYDLLAPGGVLVMANMLESHPHLPVTLHAIRWPYIQPRTLDELAQIAEEAGVHLSQIDVYLPEDGVYAVLTITK